MVVNDSRDFAKWFMNGGHALVQKRIIDKHMPWEPEPDECVQEGATRFTSVKNLPKTAFNRAPTTKLRLAVLKRDQFRCLLCGSRPADNVHVQLDAHHIRPFAHKGVTTERNLITICHTCHKGLDPHFEWSLFGLLESQRSAGSDEFLREYLDSVANYRRAIAAV
jgi:predicted restriction endonuclease